MKIFINLMLSISLFIMVGCHKKINSTSIKQIEVNQTIVEENISTPIIETPPIEVAQIETTLPIEIYTEIEPIEEEEEAYLEEEQEAIVNVETIDEAQCDAYTAYYNDEVILDGVASKIIVLKSKKLMVLLDENENVLSRHRISLGKNDVGTKLKKGDYKTPEGIYNVINKGRDKKYYKQIRISYPNREDRERSKALGFNPGGGITIHAQVPWNWNGERNDYTLSQNWTQGCIAMTNEGIDMIWNNISPQTLVDIRE
jgi:lipoprotein-anchoring transpeptidase ErfK/SrfK